MIVLDTHVVLWLTSDPDKLSAKAKAAIVEERTNGGGLAMCDISLLELAVLTVKGRLSLDIELSSFLSGLETLFVVLPITARACARMTMLPADFPQDPADRIIGATALVEGLSLVTADREIHRSKALCTIW